jgi:3D (Asp-Asp-Asp) domain-containing protein
LTVVLITLAGTALAGALFSGLKLLGSEAEPVTLMALDAPTPSTTPTSEALVVSEPSHEAGPRMSQQPRETSAAEVAPSPVAPVTVIAEETKADDASDDVLMFNGRPLRKVRTLTMKVTAYSPDERSCGKWADGFTASGYSVWTNGMKLVAADTKLLPFGTIVTVPGYHHGKPVPVLDRGGAIKGHRLDVLYPTHEVAQRWGVQTLSVDVWEYADE